MNNNGFVIRTVRNGKVRIFGQTFIPESTDELPPYDGSLDGLRLVFGLYYTAGKMDPCAYLWGSEAEYHSGLLLEYEGLMQWEFWIVGEVEEETQS